MSTSLCVQDGCPGVSAALHVQLRMHAKVLHWLLQIGAVVALWTFVMPGVVERAQQLMQHRRGADWLFSEKKQLTPGQSGLLQRTVDRECGRGSVLIVPQRAGEMVSVPPGWAHSVYNLQPSLKFA
jgi:JmjC domain, hydroxylase